ncbi:MAG: multicopper oxidase domain-containing protein [Anaerolineae bacterium]|nr:MAG: multicopper oxidase domain-containing protein [Anaerolineae bacterium]
MIKVLLCLTVVFITLAAYGVTQVVAEPFYRGQPPFQSDPTPTPDHAAHHGPAVLQGMVWVANEAGNSLSVMDAGTNTVITTLTGIEGPHNIQVAPDGKSVWAVSGHDSLAVKIDALTFIVMGTVPTGNHPAHVILTPDSQTVYVTNSEDNSLTVIDAGSLEVLATIPVGTYPHGLRSSPDGQRVYVANVNDGTLSVIDTATNIKITDIAVGEKPIQVGFSPDGAFVYVSLNAENALGKVDTISQTLVSKVEVGIGPVQVYVTPDNRYVLVANQGTPDNPGTTLSIVDVASFSLVGTVETGNGAHGVVVDPSGQFAYVTNLYENTISVVNIAEQEVIATVPTGEAPNGISFSPLAPAAPPSTEIALALSSDSSPDTASDDHDAHHPAAEDTTATPAPSGHSSMGHMPGDGEMMTQMQGMMDMMMGMEMSDEMMSMMQQMQGMMDMMTSGEDQQNMMQAMMSMMDMIMEMEMSGEMMSMMEDLQDMTSMMMSEMEGAAADQGHQMEGTGSGGHGMEPISSEGVPLATETRGGQPLEFHEEDGVKVFELTARPVIWHLTNNVQVTAWTYNGTVPGPMIRVTEGDPVCIILNNELPEPTTIHWHGIQVPNAMDGVPGVTQDPIQPGETFVYEFVAKPAGTFMYHPHFNSDTQIALGLYAPFIIDPAENTTQPDVDVSIMLSEWRVENGMTYAAMPMAGMEPNFFTFNGKAFPATDTLEVKQGERVRIRLYGIGQFTHPIHLHGVPFKVVAVDGFPIPEDQQLSMDTINVAPGQRFDIEFIATEPGRWMLHCHIPHHTTNADGSDGGMMMIVNVTE